MKILLAALLSVALIWTHKTGTPALTIEPKPKAPVAVRPIEVTPMKPQAEVVSTPPAKVQPEPVVERPHGTGCNAYRSLFTQYSWNVNVAIAVCQAESGGNAHVLSTTHDYGLMQINHIHADMVDYELSRLYNPATNIRVAHNIYSAHGWTAWNAYKNGSYRKFL